MRKLTAMLESKSTAAGSAAAIDVELFTEEPGKSAITVLSAPSKSATVSIAPGDVVELYREGSTLRAQTSRGVSLGEVDTKIARRLVPLMEVFFPGSSQVERKFTTEIREIAEGEKAVINGLEQGIEEGEETDGA